MKKKVRIYKAADGKGKVMNPTSKWMAQIGGQQQNPQAQQQAMLQQIYQYITQQLLDGTDPETLYYDLVEQGLDQQSAGMLVEKVVEDLGVAQQQQAAPQEPTTGEIITEAASNLSDDMTMTQEEEQMQDQMVEDPYTYNEAEQYMEEEPMMQTGGEQAILEDLMSKYVPAEDQNLDVNRGLNALLGDYIQMPSYNQVVFPNMSDYMIDYKPVSELKKGGKVSKKKAVKEILSYFEEGGDVENDKIGRGNMMDTATDDVARKKEGFLNSVKKEAKTAKAEELYNMMQNSSDPQMQQTAMQFSPEFMQGGGYIDAENPDLYKFIYGGDEVAPYYEADFLPEAQTGEEVRKATINYIPQRRTVPGGAFRSLFPFNPVRSVRYIPFTYNTGTMPIEIPLDQKGLKELYRDMRRGSFDRKEKTSKERLTKEERQTARQNRREARQEAKDNQLQTQAPFGARLIGWKGTRRPNRFEPEYFDVYDNKYNYNTFLVPKTPQDLVLSENELSDIQPEQGYYPSKNMLRNIISKFAFSQGGYLPKAQFDNSQVGSPIDIGLSPNGTQAIEGLGRSSLTPEILGGQGTPLGINKKGFGIVKETTTDPEAGVMAVDTALNAIAGLAERFQTPKPRQFYGDDISNVTSAYNTGTWDLSGLFRPDQAGFKGVVKYGGNLPQAQKGINIPPGAPTLDYQEFPDGDSDQEYYEYLKTKPRVTDPTRWTPEEKEWWDLRNRYEIEKGNYDKVVPTSMPGQQPALKEDIDQYNRQFNRRLMQRMDWQDDLQKGTEYLRTNPCWPLADGRCVPFNEMLQTTRTGGVAYQEGGETYMSEEQIREFLANGGELEFI